MDNRTNSPFENHGIDHLSASTINAWVYDPASYLAGLAGVTSVFGPAAWRGTATEKGIQSAITTDDDYHIFAMQSFDTERKEKGNSFKDATIQKERAALPTYIENGLDLYRTLGQPEAYQKKIVVDVDDLEIPFVGYIDFVYPTAIRDTKTSGRKPSKISAGHCRQLAVYAWAYPDRECWVDYITPKECVSWKVTQIEKWQEQVRTVALGLRKFLSYSDSTLELCSLFYPNIDDWKWNRETIEQSTTIWSIIDDRPETIQ